MKAKTLSAMALAATLATAFINPASATGGWILAADSAEGNTRYFVNAREFDYTVNKHGVHVFTVPYRHSSDGAVTEGYALVDAVGCWDSGGQLIMANAEGNRTKKFHWSPDGSRMYDSVANTICEIGKAKAANKTLTPSEKVKPAGKYY